jgi:hypothetical protein
MARQILNTKVAMIARIATLEKQNEMLTNKCEILEQAVLEFEELLKDTSGVYWSTKRNHFTRPVGNLLTNRWTDLDKDGIDERIVKLSKAIDYLHSLKEET